jgi:hypothetical protein
MRGLLSMAVIALVLAGCGGTSSTQVAGARYTGCTHFGGSSLVPSDSYIVGCGAFPPAQTVF